MFDYLSSADCLILSTNYEGMPLILLEAMSLGIPLIVSNVSGLSEMLDSSFTYFFERNSSSELVSRLNSVYSLSDFQVEEMSRFGREFYMSNYSKQLFASRYLKLVHDISK